MSRGVYFGVPLRLLFGIFVILLSPFGDAVEPRPTNLYFGVFVSLNPTANNFSSFIPPLELGVQTINNHTTVLKRLNGRNYNVNYKISDAKVRAYT